MRHWLMVVLGVLVGSGCWTFHRVRPNEPLPADARVAIAFDEPRDLEARQDATVYALPAVTKVRGDLEAVRGDTLVLLALEIESSEREPELPAEARLTIVPGASAQVSRLRLSKGLTAVVTGISVVGLFILWISTMEW